MMNQNLPNGVPQQFNTVQSDKMVAPFNGIDSSHSSRDSSPLQRYHQIPLSQLPPSRVRIPVSELPLVRGGNVSQMTHSYANLSVNENTPVSSPKVFGTSTPILQQQKEVSGVEQNKFKTSVGINFNPSVSSPIFTESTEPSQSTFTHSATSQFTNVVRPNNPSTVAEALETQVNGGSQNANQVFNRPFDSNIFTSRHNLAGQTAGELCIENKQQMPQSVQVQQNPRSQFNPQASHYPVGNPAGETAGELRIENKRQMPPSVPVQQNPRSQFNPQTSHYPIGQYHQNVPVQANSEHQSNVALTSVPRNTHPQAFMQQNPYPKTSSASTPNHVFPTNFNPMIRPNLSNTRLNASMPPSPYSQPGHMPPSNNMPEFGSMPNLAQRQMPPPGNYAVTPPPNLQNISIPPPQNIPPPLPNQNQGRVNTMHSSRYPQPQPTVPQTYQQNYYQSQPQTYGKSLSVTQAGFSKLWGNESFDLLQSPNVLPATKVEAPKISLGQDFLDAVNCNPDIFRCTMTKIPESSSLLQKSRLPLGVLIHPFKDLNHLPIIQCNTIVRCRACRTYINPFVFFVDSKRWKCNLCYRVNELPEEFQYDPVSKSYGDPSRRPEIKASTIEYIAPAEYMLRPPQPAIYLFLLDVSRLAVENGYLHTICNVLSAELSSLPGDARTHIGFLAYDSALHFYSLGEGQSQPHEMTILDIDDVFLPCPDNLLVNLRDRMELVSDLLSQLPSRYDNNYDTGSALGAALQVAYKMMAGTGGRITVFQAVLPTTGPGCLTSREDPSQRASTETPHLNPANDFYKRLALECSGQQIAVDLFVVNSQYVDLATISGISKFSGGCIHHFPLFKATRSLQNDALERCFRRYVTRKIGFEAVMRIRCTRGLSIHSFHGNFFVRSTDLLSLPNINPDAGFGMQVAIEESLSDVQTVCFQAALLYTSSKGERRIRVHTICLPVANNLTDIINSADQQCIVGLLSKMAVDRSTQSSLSDAREAFLNVAIDILSSYKLSLNMGSKTNDLLAPQCLKLLPLYISALLKSVAFRIGMSTRLDDRIKAMCDMKTKPLPYLIQQIYPDLYPIHNLEDENVVLNEDEEQVHVPPRLQLTARNLDLIGAYLLDTGEQMTILVCADISKLFLEQVLGFPDFNSIGEEMYELPTLENPHNQRLHSFINYLNDEKPFSATIQIMKENNPNRGVFLERLIEDRMENSLSYHEFLQHIKTQVK